MMIRDESLIVELQALAVIVLLLINIVVVKMLKLLFLVISYF